MYAATFKVTCDICYIVYGREDDPHRETVEGDWQGGVSLGVLRPSDGIRVVLRARPVRQTRIANAEIIINGGTVAVGGEKELGKGIDLFWIR